MFKVTSRHVAGGDVNDAVNKTNVQKQEENSLNRGVIQFDWRHVAN